MESKRIEVAYYSKLGHTKAIAEEIAAELSRNAIDIGRHRGSMATWTCYFLAAPLTRTSWTRD